MIYYFLNEIWLCVLYGLLITLLCKIFLEDGSYFLKYVDFFFIWQIMISSEFLCVGFHHFLWGELMRRGPLTDVQKTSWKKIEDKSV